MAVVLATISLSQGFDKLLVSRAAHTAGPELIGWVALGVACGEAVCSGCSASFYLWCCSLSSLNVSSICWEHEHKSYYEQSTTIDEVDALDLAPKRRGSGSLLCGFHHPRTEQSLRARQGTWFRTLCSISFSSLWVRFQITRF